MGRLIEADGIVVEVMGGDFCSYGEVRSDETD